MTRPELFVRMVAELCSGRSMPTPRQLLVGYLLCVEGLSYEAVASRLGISAGTVRRHAFGFYQVLPHESDRGRRGEVAALFWWQAGRFGLESPCAVGAADVPVLP